MKPFFYAIFILSVSLSLLAATDGESSSSLRLEPSTTLKSKRDLDDEVTDAKLRAQSGSKSKWSGSLSLGYNGASLSKPLDDKRPNVALEGNPTPTNITGSVGLRYRLDTNSSFYFATGLFMPMSSSNSGGLDASTPMLHYNRTFSYDSLQVSSTAMIFVYTEDFARDYGSLFTLSYDLSALNQLGNSRFLGGVSFSPFYNVYDKDFNAQMDYGFSLSPTLQYRLNDSFNFYTMISPFNYSHQRFETEFRFDKAPLTQSLGAGIAVARNFYLSPSFYFRPNNLDSKFIAVNLSAYINLL